MARFFFSYKKMKIKEQQELYEQRKEWVGKRREEEYGK